MTGNRPGFSEEICAVILAGGKSRRMGSNKPLMSLSGKPLILHVADLLSTLFPEIVIVTDAFSYSEKYYAHLPYPVLRDQTKDVGPIGGIETALRALPGKSLFVVGADMPFLKGAVIKEMRAHLRDYDCVIPKLEGKLHPLHAYYAPACLPVIAAAIRSNRLALHLLSLDLRTYFFPEAVFRGFDPNLRSVFNINTPEALAKAESVIASREAMT